MKIPLNVDNLKNSRNQETSNFFRFAQKCRRIIYSVGALRWSQKKYMKLNAVSGWLFQSEFNVNDDE